MSNRTSLKLETACPISRVSKRFRIIAHAMLETREKKRQVNCMPNIYCIFLEVLALGRSMDIYHQTLHHPS